MALMDIPSERFFSSLGIVWSAWLVFCILKNILAGFKAYVWPHLGGKIDPVSAYGSWAVVTGSTDGIGLAYAKQLAEREVNIVLISRSLKKLKRVAVEIEIEFGVETKIIEADFTKGESVYAHIRNELKDIPVGILVNNVGISASNLMSLSETPEKLLWDMVIVNCGAAIQMTRMILPQMQKRRKGAIVNVSSGIDTLDAPFVAIYTASKMFITNFTDAVRVENRKYGIFVQTLSPYLVLTNLVTCGKMDDIVSLTLKCTRLDPDRYARNAITTLGIVEHTSGHYIHGLEEIVGRIVPIEFWCKYKIYAAKKRRIGSELKGSIAPS